MNSKQIAEATGRAEKTVRTWVKRVAATSAIMAAKLAASSPAYPADYDLEETIEVIRYGMGGNAADLYRASAGQMSGQLPDARIDKLIDTVEKLCVLVASLIPSGAVKPAQIEAPKMTPRAELNRIVRAYADQAEIEFKEAWGLLYNEALYRLETNLPARAKHAGKPPLDVAEELGLIPQLVAIAREVFA
jgi:hypothetical protein